MTSTGQPKLKTSLRLWALLWLVAWISASGFCSAEGLFGHTHNGKGHRHPEKSDHHHAAVPADDASGHSHDSKNDCDGSDSCCSTLKAVPQAASSLSLQIPDSAKIAPSHFVLLAHAVTFVEPESRFLRQANEREWVFTPEVCFGPAHRSHAPPFLS